MNVKFKENLFNYNRYTVIIQQSCTLIYDSTTMGIIKKDTSKSVNLNYILGSKSFTYTDNEKGIMEFLQRKGIDKEIIGLLKKHIKTDYLTYNNCNEMIFKTIKNYHNNFSVNADFAIEEKVKLKALITETGSLILDLDHYYIFSYNIEYQKRIIISDFFILKNIEDIPFVFQKIESMIRFHFNKKMKIDNHKNYNFLFNSQSAGIIFHEFIGHIIEADHFYKSPWLYNNTSIIDEDIIVLENYGLENRFDDFGFKINSNIEIIKDGNIVNTLDSFSTSVLYSTKNSGNSVQGQNVPITYPRMQHMFIDSKKEKIPKEHLLHFIGNGIYIEKLNMGEVNTITGDFSVEVLNSYCIQKGEIKESIEPFFLNYDLNSLKKTPILLGTDNNTHYNLCGKNGAIVKVSYTLPSVIFLNDKSVNS